MAKLLLDCLTVFLARLASASCVAIALFSVACSPIRTSAVAHKSERAWQGRVIVLSYSPEGDADEIGVVEATGTNSLLPALVEGFTEKVASIGGNIGVVDSIRTRYEMVSHMQTYQYSCGSTKSPQTCTGTRMVTEEVGTTTIIGRAFRR